MSTTTREFYLARAEDAAKEAAAATLDNVRERARRSEAAWRSMAARMARIEEQREISERVRQDRIAREA
jgi:hypothetical protein